MLSQKNKLIQETKTRARRDVFMRIGAPGDGAAESSPMRGRDDLEALQAELGSLRELEDARNLKVEDEKQALQALVGKL